jgi:hypothetical protein
LTVTEKKALSNIRTNTYHAILLAKAAPKWYSTLWTTIRRLVHSFRTHLT